jgi:protein-S-isoprenylcysteine O-methyltransferase Ste14
VYAGAILLYLGTAFVASQLVGFVAMGVQAAGYLCKTSLEDRTLLDDLAGYGGFAARTRWRLLPGVY